MSTFSKGDRVEWLGCWSEGRTGVLLTDAISDDPHTTVLVNWDNGGQETVKIGALRKVELDAIVRPDAGQVPPWVKEREEVPVTVTISGTRIFSEESGAPMVRLETGPGSYALIPVANISSITEGGAS